ncbi:MAG: VWA domain-containing protein [Alistipes sp.]|nr:VWA domain-containing protein [Alistipes sp.]
MEFANIKILWLLTVLVPMTVWYVRRTLKGGAALRIPTIDTFRNPRSFRDFERSDSPGNPRSRGSLRGARHRTLRWWLRHVPFVFVCAATVLIIMALARPQTSESGSSTTTHGIDIVLALDISGSMLARDFSPDRIAAAKEVAANFVNDRAGDRIGLVVFAGESYTQSPLTTDRATLLNLLSRVKVGVVDDARTAIGNGLATAVNRLRESDAVSKVVILLTDGVNNAGQIAPGTAAEIAKSLGIKVYTIGVGTNAPSAPYPAVDPWGETVMVSMPVEIDEEVLTEIAATTGGEYFRATDRRSLQAIYDRIDELETSTIETNEFTRHTELYGRFALLALVLLVLEFLLRTLYLRPMP